jgi:hypothetical protein
MWAFITKPGRIYTVDFTMATMDDGTVTLSSSWQEVQPTLTAILETFRIT